MRIPEKPIIRSKLQLNVEQQKKLLKISPLFDIVINETDTDYNLIVINEDKSAETIVYKDPEAAYLRAFAEVCGRALDYVKFHITKSPAEQLFGLSDAQLQKIALSFQKDREAALSS